MPVYNHQYFLNTPKGTVLNPIMLIKSGPILPVEVSIPKTLSASLSQQGKKLPTPSSGLALIDTGATHSCVDDSIISQLGVNPIRTTTVNGSNGSHLVNVYPALFRFPSIPNFEIDFTATLGVNIQTQQFNGQPIIALIGRDVLSRCLFVYNGSAGSFSLSF